MIRIGFCGTLEYSYIKEPQGIVIVIIANPMFGLGSLRLQALGLGV